MSLVDEIKGLSWTTENGSGEDVISLIDLIPLISEKGRYTSETVLFVADLKRLRYMYNSSGDFTDRAFMNELFHGLDSIIEQIEGLSDDCDRLRKELDDANGVIR